MGTDPSLITLLDVTQKKNWKKEIGEIRVESEDMRLFPQCVPSRTFVAWGVQKPSGGMTALPTLASPFPHNPLASLFTFVQNRPEDGQAVVDGGAVPATAPELVLALLDTQLHPLGHAGHDLNVVAAEAELLGDEAGDGAAEDGLGPQGAVLLT